MDANLLTIEVLCLVDQLRRDNVPHDLILIAEGVEFPVHKQVLAASSVFFKTMFRTQSGFIESMTDRIEISEIRSDVLSEIINFSYTRQVNIADQIAQPLYAASHLMEYNSLSKLCSSAICKIINTENFINILQWAQVYENTDHVDSVMAFVGLNFSEVMKVKKFLALNYDQVVSFLNCTEVVFENEAFIFEYIFNWINEKREEREKHFMELIKYVKFSNLPTDFLGNINTNQPLLKNTDCLGLIINGYNYRSRLNTELFGFTDTEMCIFNSQISGVKNEVEFPNSRQMYSVVTLGNTIYVLGGIIDEIPTNTVIMYDPKKGSWDSICPMLQNRSSFDTSVINGKIYAVGGSGGNKSAETYDPNTNEWQMIPQMLHNDVYRAVAVEGILYVIGQLQRNQERNVQSFNVIKNYWTEETPLTNCIDTENYFVENNFLYCYEHVSWRIIRYLCKRTLFRAREFNETFDLVAEGNIGNLGVINNQCIHLGKCQLAHLVNVSRLKVHAFKWENLSFVLAVEIPQQ